MKNGTSAALGMIWWARARRWEVLAAALVAFTLLVLAFGNGASVPALSLLASGSVSVPLMLFTPVPVVAALTWCLDNRLVEAESTAVRSVWRLDTGLVATTVATAAALGLIIADASGTPVTAGVGRDAAFLTGLVLCLRPMLGQGAVMAAPGWLAVVVFFGFSPARDPYPWTIVGHAASAMPAMIAAVLSFAAGLAVLARSSRNSV